MQISSFFWKRVVNMLSAGVMVYVIFLGFPACQNAPRAVDGQTKEAGQSMSPAEAIQIVLSADEQLGARRNQACKDIPVSTAIRQYVAGIDSLDFSACPEDFSTAFRRHRDAWAASVDYFAQFDNLRGEMHALFETIAEGDSAQAAGYDRAMKAIMDTWSEVEAAARRNAAVN